MTINHSFIISEELQNELFPIIHQAISFLQDLINVYTVKVVLAFGCTDNYDLPINI